MATRFRLPASASAPVSPAVQSYTHTQTTRRPLPTSDATALATQAYAPDGADHLVAGDAHHVQFVSDPIAVQNLSAQTVKLNLQALEANAGNNLFIQLWIGLYNNAGTTLLATLLAKTLDGLELATTLNSRTMAPTTTGYNMAAGDNGARIVVEISVSGTPTAAGGTQGHNGSIRFGANGAGGDLTETDNQTGTTLNPWLEFANTIVFYNRIAQVSWAEFETPNGPRRGQVSWAEFETPIAPRRGQVSFAELEVPVLVQNRQAQVSWAEFETPNGPRRSQVSWAEFEAPVGPRRVQVSWSEVEVPSGPRRGQVSWAELEFPAEPRRSQVAWAEFEVPIAPRRGQVSFAEFETPSGPRRGRVSWAELQMPDLSADRGAQLAWVEFETPNVARRVQLGWVEFETPDIPQRMVWIIKL